MSIYSNMLTRGAAAVAGTFTGFTAPSAGTIVIRDISVHAHAGNTEAYVIWNGTEALFSDTSSAALERFAHGEGRWVLLPGDIITLSFAGAGAGWYISGYLLD